MKRQTLKGHYLKTISWFDDTIIDWNSAGQQYLLDGSTKQLAKYHYAFSFDGAITSADGQYGFIYQRLGTKGLLLKNGDILREINRPYYHAEVYEYPAAFATINDITYLIHCPVDYDQLDFENVETGEIPTNIPGRKPEDVFHSRLEVSPDNTFLISKGWGWHPVDIVEVFDIEKCLADPLLLDSVDSSKWGFGMCTASFIDDNKILVGSSNETFNNASPLYMPPKNLAVWDLQTGKLSNLTTPQFEFGNLFAINDQFAWDMSKYPKILNISTGAIVDQCDDINSGEQNFAISDYLKTKPQIIFNRHTKQIALTNDGAIEVLTPDFC